MEERRRFGRFETELRAQYISQDGERDWEECTVISICRKGIGIRFHSCEKINIGTIIRLKIFIPEKVKPTVVEGVLKWKEKRENELFGGVESGEILDEMRFSKLS